MSSREGPAGDDRGSVTLFLSIAVLGLLVMAGLVVDGGAKVRAAQRADRVAAEAARAAGQAVDLTSVLAGTAIKVDTRAALAAARAYLTASGVTGSAEVSADGRSIVVHTAASEHTVFLGLIGISELHVHGRASAVLAPGGEEARQ